MCEKEILSLGVIPTEAIEKLPRKTRQLPGSVS